MKTETERTIQTPEDVLQELRSLVTEAEHILGHAPKSDREAAGAALSERFEAAQERLTELYQGAKKKVVAGAKHTDHVIRENPYKSLAVALGIGILAGVLIERRIRK